MIDKQTPGGYNDKILWVSFLTEHREARKKEDMDMPKTQAMYLVPKELLGNLTAEELRHLKRRVVAANKAMGYWYQQTGRDCTTITSGHVSARVPGTNTFVTKGRSPD